MAPHSPWQNPFVERLIGSIRRERLDHVRVLHARHLHRVLADYFDYLHWHRPHRALDQDCPEPRAVEPPNQGPIIGPASAERTDPPPGSQPSPWLPPPVGAACSSRYNPIPI
ncbi:MAG: integrase core domain-containing protein [Verrucomicrobia bacterium]|nr:integrase core domain-containing protein [Verrucomicrobiota bacterium]